MKLFRLLFILLILMADFLWASTLPVRLLSERHRTEWNWVEYRLSLRNLSNSPLVNPTIRYFAENPRIQYCKAHPNNSNCEGMAFDVYDIDSTLRAVVDYHSLVHSVIPSFYYDSKYTTISLKFHGTIPAQATSVVHFRIMKENYPAWDCSHDYSYQANAATHENYKMAVYDGDGNILWGNDPVALKHDTTNVYWHDRGGMVVISRYDGSDSSKNFDGRFWLLKDTPLSFEERNSLDSMGAKLLETTRYQDKGLHLLKAVVPVNKKSLNKVLSRFYNAFSVDDTTKLSLAISPKDFYEEKYSCNSNDSCTTVISERTVFDMVVECWPDLRMETCKSVVLNCGGDSAYIDRSVILANIRRDSVQCLENHGDVRYVFVQREGELETAIARYFIINVASLQNDSNWQQSLLATQVTTDWLKGVDYTGEGITVGVYDSGIDFTHLAFNELDSLGNEIPRKAAGYDDNRTVANHGIDTKIADNKGFHGTHVAGIIGGNGRMSETYKNYGDYVAAGYEERYTFRGVAPKVLFHSGKENYDNQKGNVVNHSHNWPEKELDGNGLQTYFFYGYRNAKVDGNIFYNWKLPSEKGDNLTKTVVGSVGNKGDYGYHSVAKNTKNTIDVGAVGFALEPDFHFYLAHFSSLGPTWDGRIKPDIMAYGVDVISSIPYEYLNQFNYYDSYTGTSMAAPFVSGIVALMYQKFKKTTGVSLDVFSMRNSTSKALLIHSANDMQNCEDSDVFHDEYGYHFNADFLLTDHEENLKCTPMTRGPDFATGWGLVNAQGTLDLMDGYDASSEKFDKFREFDMYSGVQKRWTINVDEPRSRLRVTLAWDDAPGDPNIDNYMQPKLVNDLDLYLISPSGKIYYPWQLDTLSTMNIYIDGTPVPFVFDDGTIIKGSFDSRLQSRTGFERITYEEARKPAYTCSTSVNSLSPLDSCFDRRNNVEVVDVDNPPLGVWQVVVKGYRVEVGNSVDGLAQVASIVSDLKLNEPMNSGPPPYAPNVQTSEIIPLGDYLEHYVTFGPETSLGAGDHIYLYDGWNHLIGDYMGNSLANQRILVKTSFLKIILDSDNDNSQGYGYSISKIEHVPYGVLQVLFPPYKKGK